MGSHYHLLTHLKLGPLVKAKPRRCSEHLSQTKHLFIFHVVQSFHNENAVKLRGGKLVLLIPFQSSSNILKYGKILKLLPAQIYKLPGWKAEEWRRECCARRTSSTAYLPSMLTFLATFSVLKSYLHTSWTPMKHIISSLEIQSTVRYCFSCCFLLFLKTAWLHLYGFCLFIF